MDEIPPVAVAVVAVVVVVGAVPALALVGPALAQTETPGDGGTTATDPGTESLAPGERLAGVVGVQRAELDGEVTARAFGQRVAAAASNGSKARLVGTTVENISERLVQLSEAKRELVAAHENGSIGTGQFRAQLTEIHARQRTLQRLANETESVAAGLPETALEANGVTVTSIRTLRTEARNLTGPETAAVARSIAGRGVGNGVGPPADREPRGDRGPNANESDETDDEPGPPDDRGPNANDGEDSNETDEPGPPDDRGPRDDGNESETENESENESETENESESESERDPDGNVDALAGDEHVTVRLASP